MLGIFIAKEAGAQGADKALVKKYFMHGIYIREEALGVRLENDFVMGKNKNIDLIDKIPIEADGSALKCK